MKRIALIGFGEAAEALLEGIRPHVTNVWDVKVEIPSSGMTERISQLGLYPAASCAQAVADADWIISLVTADQAEVACQSALAHVKPGALYFECNSCSPGTKQRNARALSSVGAHLVDVAIMSPVNPSRMSTPLLVSGPIADELAAALTDLGYQCTVFGDQVGQASAVKMTRSIMIKGMEALSAECLLTAQRLGIADDIIDSLNASFPDFDWRNRGGYNLERMARHGRSPSR